MSGVTFTQGQKTAVIMLIGFSFIVVGYVARGNQTRIVRSETAIIEKLPEELDEVQKAHEEKYLPEVPRKTETRPAPKGSPDNPFQSNRPSAAPTADTVNINTASVAELEKLPGIGPVTAKNIINMRSRLGGFERTEELLEVDGIGEKKYEKIKDKISL